MARLTAADERPSLRPAPARLPSHVLVNGSGDCFAMKCLAGACSRTETGAR